LKFVIFVRIPIPCPNRKQTVCRYPYSVHCLLFAIFCFWLRTNICRWWLLLML